MSVAKTVLNVGNPVALTQAEIDWLIKLIKEGKEPITKEDTMNSEIKAGNVVTRNTATYLVVSAGFDFTNEPAYGMIDLDTYEYANLGVSTESLADICNKAKLQKVAEDLGQFNENELRAKNE